MNPKAKIVGTGFAFMVFVLAGLEGISLDAYQDIVGVWTICHGHTEGVKPGDHATKEQCREMLKSDAQVYWDGVDDLVEPAMRPREHIAFTLLAYNIGLYRFSHSTLLKKANAGNMAGACLEILKWRYAGGRNIPVFGLDRRRKIEHDICIGATVE